MQSPDHCYSSSEPFPWSNWYTSRSCCSGSPRCTSAALPTNGWLRVSWDWATRRRRRRRRNPWIGWIWTSPARCPTPAWSRRTAWARCFTRSWRWDGWCRCGERGLGSCGWWRRWACHWIALSSVIMRCGGQLWGWLAWCFSRWPSLVGCWPWLFVHRTACWCGSTCQWDQCVLTYVPLAMETPLWPSVLGSDGVGEALLGWRGSESGLGRRSYRWRNSRPWWGYRSVLANPVTWWNSWRLVYTYGPLCVGRWPCGCRWAGTSRCRSHCCIGKAVPQIGAQVDDEAVEVTPVISGVELCCKSDCGRGYVVRITLMTKMQTIRKMLSTMTRKRYRCRIRFILLDFVIELAVLEVWKDSVWRRTIPTTNYSIEIGMPLGRMSLLDMTASSYACPSKQRTASKVEPSLLMKRYWMDKEKRSGLIRMPY